MRDPYVCGYGREGIVFCKSNWAGKLWYIYTESLPLAALPHTIVFRPMNYPSSACCPFGKYWRFNFLSVDFYKSGSNSSTQNHLPEQNLLEKK